ncbi:MAG: glycine cleavage system aminomethyltransferase GcvT, partial [candidate division NC10 bacterium]|nr:glycine cleavage system aminomethyltransferase GcvT [candidate division NC10 bacterium]
MAREVKRTALHAWHREQKAQMVEFAGREMPVAYPPGIVEEHLRTRSVGGLFDISHMGRFWIDGKDAVPFLQKMLTSQVLALNPGMAQYTLIPNEQGGAIDDCFLYRLEKGNGWFPGGYLLVVNAANRERDWEWLSSHRKEYRDLTIEDHTDEVGMIALQGPRSRQVLEKIIEGQRASLPEPWRNRLRLCQMEGVPVIVSRTGYTGEPICFELFLPGEKMGAIWERILSLGEEEGILPVGLGARDTLRLEAALPLYGHELGQDLEGKEIPLFAVPNCRSAVSFSPLKGDFIGREALLRQWQEVQSRMEGGPTPARGEQVVPRRVAPVAVLDPGVARRGAEVWAKGERVGQVTSGTMVPYWKFTDQGILSRLSGERGMRAIALAYLDFALQEGERIEIRQRGKSLEGVVVRKHLSGEAPPYARPVLAREGPSRLREAEPALARKLESSAESLLQKVMENTHWRQREAINLIPSEMTASPMTSFLS